MHATYTPESRKALLKAYALGFLASLLLTFIAFAGVYLGVASSSTLVPVLITTALVQAIIQLICFLHLGQGTKPDWNLIVFLFMALVLVIIVVGSIWIMANLNYRIMPGM